MITTEQEYRITRRWYLIFKTAMDKLVRKNQPIVLQDAARSQWERLQAEMATYELARPDLMQRAGAMIVHLDEIRVGDKIDGDGSTVTDVRIQKNEYNPDLYEVVIICNDGYGDCTFAGSWDDTENIHRPAPTA